MLKLDLYVQCFRTSICEWSKILRIIQINVNVLEILYEKLFLLNDYSIYSHNDLLDSYILERNLNHYIKNSNFNKILEDIQITGQNVAISNALNSGSVVMKSIASANSLNRYLFQQQEKIRQCLNDILMNINKFKSHLNKISNINTECTININRCNDYKLKNLFELLCNVYLKIKIDFENKQKNFCYLSQAHAKFSANHGNTEQRNHFFMTVLNQLKIEIFSFVQFESLDIQLAKSQASLH